ncbi:nuclear transport factor 2 family protein [Capnocytophaga sp.]|uniref:nuclear transport factor 2 family protein n=1 Tax=Capnocytophaga sp. TaxID=44737 RepID=UPI0026DC121A|nr:nuclear transport factor 2 family protein [Capnocytophaga sp.]MDO5105221.1 nuclear transport factor 2 family protein [Capnocytophaga sp.]
MTNTEIIKNYFQALAKDDIETAFSCYANDVKWHQPGKNKFSGLKNGISEIGAMIGQMIEDTQGSFRLEISGNIMENANFVLAPISFSGKKSDEKQLNMNGIDMFEILDGKITQVWLFSDDQQLEDEFWG